MAHWFKADAWERASFKRRPEGWIFRSPISWPFGLGPHRHYLVNETQKAEIVTALNHLDARGVAVMALALLTAVPMLVLGWIVPMSNDLMLNLLIGSFLAGLWLQVVLNVYHWLLLRSTLADARRTGERITFIERLKVFAAMTPTTMLIAAGLVFWWGFGISAFEVFIWEKWNTSSLVLMVLGGLSALYICAMLTVKLKAGQPAGS